MTLFSFEYQDASFDVVISMHGIGLLHNDQLLEQTQLKEQSALVIPSLNMTLNIDFKLSLGNLFYKVVVNDEVVEEKTVLIDDRLLGAMKVVPSNGDTQVAQKEPVKAKVEPKNRGFIITLGLLALKLFKSAKVLKVALVGASVGAYSVLFDWRFAVILVCHILFHELGHNLAAKRLGIKTKGIYLIPFVGGVALSEGSRTQWETVYIAMMGPVFGLVLTLVFCGLYLVTGAPLYAVAASFGALINLFNLLPILPLDGGQVFRSIMFSTKGRLGFFVMIGMSAISLVGALYLGFSLLVFFIIIGFVDLLASQRMKLDQHITEMKPYAMVISVLWYLLTVALLLTCLVMMANTGIGGTDIPATLLSS